MKNLHDDEVRYIKNRTAGKRTGRTKLPVDRSLRGLDQIQESVRNTRRMWQAEVDSVLFFDDEEFAK